MQHVRPHTRVASALWLILAASPAAATRADEATDQYNLASGFFNMNRFDFAAEEYEKFVKDYPKHAQIPEALYFLGESYHQLGKTEPARNRFREVVTQHANSKHYFYALYRLGETNLLLDDPKAAEQALAEFVSKRAEDPLLEFALADLGSAQLQNGKPAEAKATLRASLDKFPKGRVADRAQFDLAKTLERLNDSAAALELYRALAANTASRLADDAQMAIGVRLYDERNFAAALGAFENLEQRFSASPLVSRSKLHRALCLYQLDRYDQAAPLFQSLVQGEAKDVPEAWYGLGLTQRALGQRDVAAQTLLASYAKFGSSPIAAEMLFFAAQANFEQGKFDAAVERYLEVTTKFPQHELADDGLYYAAESARTLGQNDRVFALATQFYTQFPSSPLVNRMALTVGQSLIALGRHDEASKYLAAILDRQPDAALAVSARYYNAVALQAAGRIDQAIAAVTPLLAEQSTDAAVSRVLADAQFLAGACFFQKNDFSNAVAPLEKYVAAQPSGKVVAYALEYLAVSHTKLGQFDRLAAPLAAMRTKVPAEQAVPAIYRVAEACFETKQFALAADLFTDVVGREAAGEHHAKALSGLGWSRFQEGKHAEAATAFAQLVAAHPDDALASEAAYMRGRALEAASKFDDAAAAYQFVLAKYAQSAQAFDASLQLARSLHKAGKPQQAIAAYDQLAKQFPKAPSLDTVFNEWAWVHLVAGQEVEAQALFERLAAEFPASPLVPEATLNVAEALFQARKYQDVLARVTPMLSKQLPPKVREAVLYRAGRTHIELGRWAEAKAHMESLRREFPQSTLGREAEFWIAESERRGGQPKAAAERLTKLVAEPAEPEPWFGTAWLRLAQCHGELKQWKEMLAAVEELKKRFPKYELMNVADYHAGRALQNLARFDEAREAYRRAIAGRADENSAQSQFMIGETYFHQKQYQQALREFLKVEILYAFPHWQAAALLEAAKCHESLQEWSRAAETYNRILEKYPKTTHAGEAAQRLEAARKRVTASTSSDKGTP